MLQGRTLTTYLCRIWNFLETCMPYFMDCKFCKVGTQVSSKRYQQLFKAGELPACRLCQRLAKLVDRTKLYGEPRDDHNDKSR